MDIHFLLHSAAAQQLYHDHAADLPIIDYHCHLPPADIARDARWENLAQVWLGGDHYKWRALRSNGVPERFVTGDAPDRDKFQKWAETMPRLVRNPLYHWTHLELQRVFGIDKLLGPDSADEIYARAAEKLAAPAFSARGLLHRFRVRLVCTTDDPADSLEHHRALREEGFETAVLPTFRPDKAMNLSDPAAYTAYIKTLSAAAGLEIRDFRSLLEAVWIRHDFFHESGCRLSDHGVLRVPDAEAGEAELNRIVSRALSGERVTPAEEQAVQAVFLLEVGRMNHARNWTQQFHVGAYRNNNTRMFEKLGPDTGFDSIADARQGPGLIRLLDRLDRDGRLAKTILYNLNPADNALMASLIGCFQDGSVPGKIQWGSGWWFLDQKDGMERQIETLSQMGLLSRFVGMLTDSRSFLSYPRHEYFRRILCNTIGADVERGELPDQMDWLGQVVEDICYRNARDLLGFDLP
jgi:glucuronate isomerase